MTLSIKNRLTGRWRMDGQVHLCTGVACLQSQKHSEGSTSKWVVNVGQDHSPIVVDVSAISWIHPMNWTAVPSLFGSI
jgi:hypothetical protein